GHPLDGVDDAAVAGAAADVARQLFADLELGRRRVAVEQVVGGHDQTGRAEAALDRPGVDERPLHVGWHTRLGQALDRTDRPPDRRGGHYQAGADQLAAD